MRVERFKMEREGLVTEGQEVEISERSAVTGQYTYLVEPSIAMSGIYRTRQRIKSRKGKIQKIEQTDRGYYCGDRLCAWWLYGNRNEEAISDCDRFQCTASGIHLCKWREDWNADQIETG